VKGLLEDIRHALRVYRRTPSASLMMVAVLAIGMAFVTAFLSLYSDLILRPEPGFQKGGRIVSVGWSDGKNAGGLPIDLYGRINGATSTLDAVAGTDRMQVRVGPEKKQVFAEMVTRQFFPGLRPKLALGTGFKELDNDEDSEPVVVISWRYWQEQFAGRADVLGKTILVSGPPRMSLPAGMNISLPPEKPPLEFRIVGVMDRSNTGSLPPQAPEKTVLWIPVERALSVTMADMPAQFRSVMLKSMQLRGIGRLAAGASAEAATRELKGRFADEEFIKKPGAKYEVIDHIVQNIFVQRETQRQLRLFLGGSVLLALVAAANVSLFLLARAPGRRRELGIRMAVGAPVKRLGRQLASEAAVLVVAAAVIGLVLSIWLAKFLRGLPFLRQAQWRDVTLLDWRVLGLVGLFLMLVTVLVSLAPIAGLKRLGIAASSRIVSARATMAQRVAGTAQIAVACTLSGAAIAFAWHLISVLTADPGYRTTGLYAVPYSIMEGKSIGFMMRDGKYTVVGAVDSKRLHETLQAVPGVKSVSLTGAVPGLAVGMGQITVPDPRDPQKPIQVRTMTVDDHYVGLFALKLLHGRNVNDNDPGGVLVNQAFARRFFGREDVAGEPLPDLPAAAGGRVEPALIGVTHIVGVLPNLSYQHPLDTVDPTIFIANGFSFSGVAIIESTLAAGALQKPIQDALRTVEQRTMGNIEPLSRIHDTTLAPDRARGLLTIATAVIVVLLAAIGFYGTQRYLVIAGRREYAIRASLGAGPLALGRLVLSRGLMLGLPGLILGLPLAFILVAWLRGDYVSRAISPAAVSLVVALALVALLLLATAGPARLARRTQPAPLLRED